LLVNPLVQAPAQAEASAVLQQAGHDLIKVRLDHVIGVQDLEVFALVGKIEAAVKVAEEAQVFWIPCPFAFDGLELSDDPFRVVRRAVVHDNDPIGAQGLAGQ